jgi:Phosphate-selective porin O and P
MKTVHRALARVLPAVAVVGALTVGTRTATAQVSVGGVIYGQYLYRSSDSLHLNGFDITRAYVNFTGRFTGGVGFRVTSDIYRVADSSTVLRLKYAYATWTPEKSPLTFKMGLIHTPIVDWEEALWNYRMQGSIAVDRNKLMTSADFGAGVDGAFDHERFNFQAGAYNGEGYSGGMGDRYKDVEARASYRLMATDDASRVGGLRITGYVGIGQPSTGGRRNRFMGMLSYRSNDITVAGEYVAAQDSVGTTAKTDKRLVSGYAVLHVPNTRFSVLGRVDLYDPNTASASNTDQQTRVIAGVAYQVSPNLRLLADVDHLGYQSGYTPTAAQKAAQTSLLFQFMASF